jgi:hypothetical protein
VLKRKVRIGWSNLPEMQLMNKQQVEMLFKKLDDINEKLETLIILQKRAAPKPEVGAEEAKILKFCDKKHTIDDIVKETGKTENNVKVALSRLRSKGLIRSVDIKGIIVYDEV